MVNPGTFRGLRKEFLLREKVTYSEGVTGGYARDALANIQRRYFKRFPVELPLDVEPTEEYLAQVDDEAPDADPEVPNEDELSKEDYEAAMAALQERRTLIVFRKAQIKRWLAYQYMKDNDLDPKESGAANPYRKIFAKLTGDDVSRPRLCTPVNLWRRSNREEVEEEAKRRVDAEGSQRKGALAPMRAKVAKEMFSKLSKAEQKEYADLAKAEHKEAMEKWEVDKNAPISTKPEDLQRCIARLGKFMQPILDLVSEHTGWKVSFFAGGPEPAHGGRLHCIHLHSGSLKGDVKMTFGRAEAQRIQKQFLPMFADFLRKCYTPEECRERALSKDEGFESLMEMELEENVLVEALEGLVSLPTPSQPASRAQSPKAAIQSKPKSSTAHKAVSKGASKATATKAASSKSGPKATLSTTSASALQSAATSSTPSAPSQVQSKGASPTSSPPEPVAVPSDAPTDEIEPPHARPTPSSVDPPSKDATPHGEAMPCEVSSPPSQEVPLDEHATPIDQLGVPHASKSMANHASSRNLSSGADCPSISEGSQEQETTAHDTHPATPDVDQIMSDPPTPDEDPSDEVAVAQAHNQAPTAPVPSALSLPPTPPRQSRSPSPGPPGSPLRVLVALDQASTAPAPSAPSRPPTPPRQSRSPSPGPPASPPPRSPSPSSSESSFPSQPPSPERPRRSKPASQLRRVRRGDKDTGKDPEPPPTAPPGQARKKRRRDEPTGSYPDDASEPPPPKRSRISKKSGPKTRDDTQASRLDPPPGAPEWFSRSLSLFSSEGLGDEWSTLLSAWTSFEQQQNYDEKGLLPSKGRPAIVKMWIARGRPTTWRPQIGDVKELEKDFTAWWTSLQPSWRLKRGKVDSSALEGDWESLRISGTNGLQSVIAALFYWGLAVRELRPAAQKGWTTCVRDCASVIARLS